MNKRALTPYEQTQLAKHTRTTEQLQQSTIPVEYITGHADFCGLDFLVNPSVLIPRVETEGLVELALQVIAEKQSQDTVTVAEIGVGSGAVIITVAKHLEQAKLKAKFFGSDISKKALETAQQNMDRLIDSAQIDLIESDLLNNVPDNTIDLLIANLPYIPTSRINKLDNSVKDHEPLLALDGGTDGFTIIATLLNQSIPHLSSNAVILLEVDSTHTKEFFLPWKYSFSIITFPDCFNKHRFVRLDLLS